MKLPKETKSLADHGKWYRDACGTAFAMELVGERWSMLIIRELMLGGRRFSDLRASLPGISAKVLTERLAGLEQAGVLVRRKLPPPAASQVYELTEWGYLAEPAIQELGRWAARSPGHDARLPLSPVSFMLSMRTMIDKQAAPSLSGTIGFETGGESFVGRLAGGELPIERGPTAGADAVFRAATPMELAALFYGKVPPGEWERGEGRRIDGDRVLARRFLDLFRLPEKVG
ncbi:MAG TPA: helix-turn-helix domain-containing protein [Croceibacterium sp.]|nr:helix-turn-helix domain-containing protein [Croceibacterium sp.]